MKWPTFGGSGKGIEQKKELDLVAGFKADAETDAHYLFDLTQSQIATDEYIEKRLTEYRTDDGRTLEQYLEPYINAITDGSAQKWFEQVRPTQSIELIRITAARSIAEYLMRKRKKTGGTIN